MGNKNKSEKTLKNATIYLVIGILLLVITPALLTRPAFDQVFQFTNTGEIGDTIGGLTAPIVNLLGAILVFLALKEQVRANVIIQRQIEEEKKIKSIDNETNNLNQLYNYVNESINNFRFTCLTIGYEPIRDKDGLLLDNELEEEQFKECYGNTAFSRLFNQIMCNYHGEMEDLISEPSVSEVYSILQMIDILLEKLKESKSSNKEIITTLIEHQFNYRVIASIRDDPDENLKAEPCEHCKRDHGIPSNILSIIQSIRKKLSNNV